MEQTAKNFALQLGSLIALYVSLGSLLVLLFGIINIAFPDAAESYWQVESASTSIRFSIASLIVFFPTYLILTRMVNTIRRRESGTYLALTKWLIYLSLLVGGGVLLGDLVALINTFLSGELVTRFLLKSLSVFVVVGAAFAYYLLDARSYWQQHEKRSVQYGIAAAVVVLAVIVAGFFHTETPSEVREKRIDDEQINALQNMQWQIIEYYNIYGALPETLDEAFEGLKVPVATDERDPYEYRITENGFELCATFAHPTPESSPYALERSVIEPGGVVKNPYNWNHGDGSWCFERVIVDVVS